MVHLCSSRCKQKDLQTLAIAALAQFELPQCVQGRLGSLSRLMVLCLQSLHWKNRFTALIVRTGWPSRRHNSEADKAV